MGRRVRSLNNGTVNNQREFWLEVQKRVLHRDLLGVLCVVESVGSSPGRAGFKMCVTHGSGMFGSIGGGSMEHKLVELTRTLLAHQAAGSLRAPGEPGEVDQIQGTAGYSFRLREDATADEAKDPAEVIGLFDRSGSFPLLKRQIHQADIGKDRSGMICSGEQTVAFFFLHGEEHIQLVADLIAALDEPSKPREMELSSSGIRIVPAGERPAFGELEWSYYEALRAQPRIAIIGAGHVSLALSRLMDQLGFLVEIYDERQGLNTWQANTFAQQRRHVDYAHISEHLPEDPELYVVLASFGFRTDDVVLRQLIRNRYKYLGMLGSAEKVRVMFEAMRKDGFTEAEIARVRTPIGIAIHSRTPEEIAVSIAAEIIGVKNAKGSP